MRSPNKGLFVLPADYNAGIGEEEVEIYRQEAAFFTAHRAMEVGNTEEAITGFQKTSMPEASFYQAQVRECFVAFWGGDFRSGFLL